VSAPEKVRKPPPLHSPYVPENPDVSALLTQHLDVPYSVSLSCPTCSYSMPCVVTRCLRSFLHPSFYYGRRRCAYVSCQSSRLSGPHEYRTCI